MFVRTHPGGGLGDAPADVVDALVLWPPVHVRSFRSFSGLDTDANFLRLMAIANDVFKPGKHEKNGDGGGPFPAQFLRPPPEAVPPEAGSAPPPSSAPGTLVDAHGQEYVDAG
jgi:hypothetical protein